MSAVLAVAPIAPVLAEASVRAEQVTQLVLGDGADLLARDGEWLRIRAFEDGYEGWVNRGYVRELPVAEAQAWRARATAFSEGAGIALDGADGWALALPLRARVALENGRVTLPDGRAGAVARGSVRELADVAAGARRVAPEVWAFEHFAGSPYQWGGRTPWGVDCSGLVQTTYLARGVALPRDSGQQVNVGAEVALDAIRPGDLLFFQSERGPHISHVAFAGDGETLVHSTISCGGVLREPYGPGSRAAALMTRLVAARRIA